MNASVAWPEFWLQGYSVYKPKLGKTAEISSLLRKAGMPEHRIAAAASRIANDVDRAAMVSQLKRLALFVSFPCVRCSVSVSRLRRVVRGNLNQGKAGPFCGKKCAAAWGKRGKNGWFVTRNSDSGVRNGSVAGS